MNKLIMIMLLLWAPLLSNATDKNYEKAKMDLISNIEILINIDECRKDLTSPNVAENELPRSCNKLEYLSKYFFVKKNADAIADYLASEESKINKASVKILGLHKIKSLGKMTLSNKCHLSREPVDLDVYLKKIKGEELPIAESIANPRFPAAGSDLPEVKKRK